MSKMKIKAFLLCFFTAFSLSASAKSIRDLYFEIHSDDIKSLIESKASLKKFENFHCEIYWIKDRSAVVVKADELNKELKEIVAKACEKKSFLVRPFELSEYLKPFKKKEKRNDWQVYIDDTGVNKINEVWVKKGKDELDIIEKRPIGTTKINYKFIKGKKLIDEVSFISYEGIQNVKTKSKFEYEEVSGFMMPKKLVMETEQNLSRKEIGDYTRKFSEVFHFLNYKINDSKALMYFNQN